VNLMKWFNFCTASLLIFGLSAHGAEKMNPEVQRIYQYFEKLDKEHLDLTFEFYDKNVEFHDPVVVKHGASAMRDYYAGLYKNVDSIRFAFSKSISEGHTHVVFWTMHMTSPKLNGGKEIIVDGNSHIEFGGSEGKVIYHRDFFDMGAFVYERIPFLGSVIGFIKKRMDH
jgi:hypothetical protein